jgi:hypothetical protein
MGSAQEPPARPPLSLETLQVERDGMIAEDTPDKVLTDPAISHREVTIPGPGGKLVLSILEPKDSTRSNRPGIYSTISTVVVLSWEHAFLG